MRAPGVLLAGLVVVLCACGSTSQPAAADIAKPSPTATATPSEQPYVAPFAAIDFLNRSNGWAVMLSDADKAVEVVRTTDGGVTWGAPVKVTSLNVPAGYAAPHFGVRFANADDGWLFGQGLFVTTNGGATWSATSVRADVYDVGILESSAWAVTDAGLFRSNAGSTTWTAMPSAPIQGGGPFQLIRATAQVAFIAQQAQFETRLFRTSDGGATWHDLGAPCRGYGMPVATLDGVHLWMICASEPGAGNQAKWTYTSDDSGAHWTLRAYNDGVKATGSMPSNGYAHWLAIISTTTGFMANDRGDLYRSTDQGTTWFGLNISHGEGLFAALQFVDPSHGWLAAETSDISLDGRVGLFRTTDGGATWQLVSSAPGRI